MSTVEQHPIVTHNGNGVVFSAEQATELFANLPLCSICLCVDVPRCLWVASLHDALEFFKNGT